MEKAGFWKLCLAYVIDSVVTFIGGVVLGALIGLVLGFLLGLMGAPVETITGICFLAGSLAGYLLNIAYFSALEATTGASLGKRVMGIKVYKA